jgi:hypothetical protein
MATAEMKHLKTDIGGKNNLIDCDNANPVTLAQSPKSRAKARASIDAYHKKNLSCASADANAAAAAALPCKRTKTEK